MTHVDEMAQGVPNEMNGATSEQSWRQVAVLP